MRDRYSLPRDARILEESWDYITGHARYPHRYCATPDGRWAALCVYAALAGLSPLEMFADLDLDAHDGVCRMVTCDEKASGQAVQARYCEAHMRKRNRPLGDKTIARSWLEEIPTQRLLNDDGEIDGWVTIGNLRKWRVLD